VSFLPGSLSGYDFDMNLDATQVIQRSERLATTKSVDRRRIHGSIGSKEARKHPAGRRAQLAAARAGGPAGDPAAASAERPSRGSTIAFDSVSMNIIDQLQADGRRSYAAIGKAVGLSEAAVRQRVQRLLELGVMEIVAVTDPMSLGFRRQAMIGIRCDGDLERVADLLAGMDAIDYVVITAGSFDLLAEVVCEDDDQLLDILGQIRSLPGVMTTETFVYLKLRKQTYHWGTR
jgi:Lrp/AsnC family transcriptional regulator, regulator for asnA, asnC and gidA